MPSTTPNLGLYKPDIGQTNWGAQVNGNWDTLDAITSGAAFGLSGVRYLQGANNVTTPNTKFDLSADLVMLRNPSTGLVVVRAAPINSTVDFGVNGVNGLDTGVIASNTWYHLYFIWNGTVLASLASLALPLTGPTLMPAGYTYWAYAGAVRADASAHLLKTYLRGGTGYYQAQQLLVNATPVATEQAVNVATAVPPNAIHYGLNVSALVTVSAAAGGTFAFRVATGQTLAGIRGATGLTTTYVVVNGQVRLPNVGLQYLWLYTPDSGTITGGETQQAVEYYVVPNGEP